ncbi:LysR family transcriptional regulator [Thermoactinospora rubra]|uniref:LysR family transcriptional regulator n=1 Tax=Thermoactinospora rubra TaxID=1088767 RepID=UPI000A110970|nr:LysR family transcriptional regulator [Thermoactinospora rubra]
MELEVRHLRVLRAIADTGSISKAAATMGMSQPAVAAQLRRIERMFGGRLFDRGHDGARPTPLGDWLLARSRPLLPAFDELERSARRYARDSAQIRVACALTRLAGMLARSLHRLLPGADITLRTEESTEVIPGLLASARIELGSLDEYPGHELTAPPGTTYVRVATEPIFVGLAPGHPLAACEEVDLADLSEEDWAQPCVIDAAPREHFWRVCAEHGFTPRVAYGVTVDVALELISEGRCVGLFQASGPVREGIAIRPLKGSPLRFGHVLGWTDQGPIAPHAHDLVEAVTKTYWAEARRNPDYHAWLQRHEPL